MKTPRTLQLLLLLLSLSAPTILAQTPPTSASPAKVIIDTDIGDDIDDAFAVVLALRSPELKVLGFTTTFGDTLQRAKLLDRLLADTGHGDIPVAVGTPTTPRGEFTQKRYATARPNTRQHEDATAFLTRQIKQAPGEITLIAIGPLGNIGALIEKDPATFRLLKRVVLMGGSIDRGYGDLDYEPVHGPDPEWNILNNPVAAQRLVASGVPLYILPLDSTQLKLDEVKRSLLFKQGNPYTDALTLLYAQWGQQTPTLFDPMTVAWLLKPSLCPMIPIRIRVDAQGYTRREPGEPNAQVCLSSSPEEFFRFYIPRLLPPRRNIRSAALYDPSPANHFVSLVKYRRLPRRDRPLRLIEDRLYAVRPHAAQRSRRGRVAVPNLNADPNRLTLRQSRHGDPVQPVSVQLG